VNNRETERHLRTFSELYVQIGVLEKLLRVVIPQSLGSNAYDPTDLEWMKKLPKDQENEKRYQKALIRRKLERKNQLLNITDLLPFSFWKNILHSRNFTSLWVPYTHTILGPAGASKTFSVYRKLESRLYLAHKDRNLIAHYNTSLVKGVDASLENVRWLQEAMGLVKAE